MMNKKSFVKTFVVAGLVLSSLTTLQAQEYNGVVKSSYMSVRKEAKFNSVIVAKKMRGDVYKVLYEDKNWIKVQFADGVTGWLFKTVTNRADDDYLPDADTATSTEKIEQKRKGPPEVPDGPEDDDYVEDNASGNGAKKSDASKSKTNGGISKSSSAKDGKSGKASSDKKSAVSGPATEKNMSANGGNRGASNSASSSDSVSSSNAGTNSNASSSNSTSGSGKSAKVGNAGSNSKTAVAEISSNAEDLYNEAIALYAKRQYEDALEKNMLASKKAPKNAEIMNNIGNCLFKLGKDEKALEYWKKALKLAPKSGKICSNIGIAYYQMNKTKDAIEYYKKAILFEPDYADAYYNLASAYGYNGDFSNAAKNFQLYMDKTDNEGLKKLASERLDYCEKQMKKN